MKTRTCPCCEYRYSRANYAKELLFKFILSKWNCLNCGQEITFDHKRRNAVAIAFGLWTMMFFIAANRFFAMDLMWWGLLLVVYLSGTVFIFTFDNFAKTNRYDWYSALLDKKQVHPGLWNGAFPTGRPPHKPELLWVSKMYYRCHMHHTPQSGFFTSTGLKLKTRSQWVYSQGIRLHTVIGVGKL